MHAEIIHIPNYPGTQGKLHHTHQLRSKILHQDKPQMGLYKMNIRFFHA